MPAARARSSPAPARIHRRRYDTDRRRPRSRDGVQMRALARHWRASFAIDRRDVFVARGTLY